jgi:hypothetical protein
MDKTEARLKKLLSDFSFYRMCDQLEIVTNQIKNDTVDTTGSF